MLGLLKATFLVALSRLFPRIPVRRYCGSCGEYMGKTDLRSYVAQPVLYHLRCAGLLAKRQRERKVVETVLGKKVPDVR